MQQGLISLPWQSVVIEDPSSEAKKPLKNKTPKQTNKIQKAALLEVFCFSQTLSEIGRGDLN